MPFTDASVEAVFGDNMTRVETVYGYWNGSWSYWIPGVPSTLARFEYGHGYWVLADGNFTVTIIGYPAGRPPLLDDWNLIGINGTNPIPLEELFAGDLSKVKYVYGFDNELKEYSHWISGLSP